MYKKIFEELLIKSVFIKLKNIYKLVNESNDFYDLLIDSIDEDERKNIIEILNTCKCCKRHQNKRPSIEQYLDGYVPNYSMSNNLNEFKCCCPCRHYIRHICRAKNDEIIEY